MADRIILPRATDDNFEIVAGAEAYFYDTGTTSEQTVYSDEAGTVPVSQPLTADAEGVFAATFATSPVKVVVKDPSGVTLPGYPSDPHPKVPASGSSADNVSFSPITGNAATNVQAAIQNLTTLWNNVTTFGKSLIAASSASVARSTLGLGSAAEANLLDEDDMASDDATAAASQQSVKAYVDNQTGNSGPTTLNTETAIDFTSIPDTATEIEVIFNAASLDGTDDILIQIGDSGGVETTGYVSSGALTNNGVTGSSNSTSGFYARVNGAGRAISGAISLRKEPTTDTWVASGVYDMTGGIIGYMGGIKTLSATLDRVRVTRTGTDTFDGGQVSVTWRA